MNTYKVKREDPKDIEPCDFCEGQHCTALYDRDGSDVRVMDNELCIDSFMRCGDCNNASQFYAEIKINYCPMCGRKLEKFKN